MLIVERASEIEERREERTGIGRGKKERQHYESRVVRLEKKEAK